MSQAPVDAEGRRSVHRSEDSPGRRSESDPLQGPSTALAERRGVQLDFIRPGKPVENASIEAFRGRLRDECLNVHQFTSIDEAKTKIEAWRINYNRHHPHSSLGHLTPDEFYRRSQVQPTPKEAGDSTLELSR